MIDLPLAFNCCILFHCTKYILVRLFSCDSNLGCLKLVSCTCFIRCIYECFSGVGKFKRNCCYAIYIFRMFKYCQTALQSDCMKFHSHQHCTAVSFSTYLPIVYILKLFDFCQHNGLEISFHRYFNLNAHVT